jgi:hypothetical protein
VEPEASLDEPRPTCPDAPTAVILPCNIGRRNADSPDTFKSP